MKALDIYEQIKTHKGQHIQASWRRECKLLKGVGVKVEKQTIAYIRAGINFANLASVKNGIELGERGEVQPLPWGQWRKGFFPFIIDHTPKGQTESIEYIRLYPASFDNLTNSIRVQYYLNGEATNYETIETYLQASEKRNDERDKPECFTVKAASVQLIN